MRIQKFLATALALGVLCPVLSTLAKEKLRTPEQRFGGDIKQAESPSFRRHVVPLASKLGCSGRECHGSFQGRGGFQLSLFGYDFKKDHTAITNDKKDDIRVDLEHPEKSLFIVKPTKQVKHKGGEVYELGSWEHNLMLKWIQEGAKIDVKETGTFGRLEVFPKEIVFKKAGDTVQLTVLAHWADGTVEDVTEFSRFRTNDDSVVITHEGGLVESKAKGDTHVVAFYDNGVAPVPAMLALSAATAKNYPKVNPRTKIDGLVSQKLRKLGIVPSGLCTDSEFLRRASLDITGTLPTPAEVKKFLADKNPKKRTRKIDELLERPGHAAWWATKLSDFTGNNARNGSDRLFRTQQSRQWYDWIYHRLVENQPYDKLVAGIVMATGREKGQGYLDFAKEMSSYVKSDNPADFAKRETMPHYWARRDLRQPQQKALAFAYSFLGVRIQCAQCHKHPFDQWTQNDYKQFQEFFEPIRFGNRVVRGEDMNARVLQTKLEKEMDYNRRTSSPQKRREVYAKLRDMASKGEAIPWQELFIQMPNRRQLTPAQIERIKRRRPDFTGRVFTPKLLGGDEVTLADFPDPRAPLMEWLSAPENPYFSRAFVNRVWANYFGRGIVEPADELNLANPPSNKPLFDYLAKGFSDSGYDMRWLHREILNSDTYQRSWRPNDTNQLDDKNFSRAIIRRLPAELVADAIAMATSPSSVIEKFAENIETRAMGPGANSGYRNNRSGLGYALSVFGKPERITACDCERSNDPTLLQTIFTRNDPDMLARIDSNGRAGSWISELRRANGRNNRPQANNTARQLEQWKRALAGINKRAQQLQRTKPQQPKGDDQVSQKRFQQALKVYQQQVEKLSRTKAYYVKRIAAVQPKKPAKGEQLATKQKHADLINEAFLRTLSRFPTEAEMKMATTDLAAAGDPIDALRDLLWALLNTKEFVVNH